MVKVIAETARAEMATVKDVAMETETVIATEQEVNLPLPQEILRKSRSLFMTDQELVKGIIGNDQAAFRCLVDRYQQPVIRTCYSLIHQMEDAEDVAQDVFMEIVRSIPGFKGEARLSSWIYRIAINKSLNHIKRLKRKERLFGIFPKEFSARITQEMAMEGVAVTRNDTLEDKDLKQALHQAIAKLPENQRIAFTLHNYEDLAYKEVADIMQLTLASVESLLHRAKKNLQNYLQTYYASL